MEIEIRVHAIGGAFAGASDAVRRWRDRRGWVVAARCGALEGLGEASPLPGYGPDAPEQVEDELRTLGGFELDVRDPLAGIPAGLRTSAARFAVETAVLDLVGKHRGLEMCELLSPDPAEWLGVAPLAQSPSPGLERCKVKIGRDLNGELELVRQLRAGGTEVRVDANRSLPTGQLRAILGRLADLGVEHCEEPTAPQALLAASDVPLPIALDESLQDERGEALAEVLAARGVLAALVIKPAAVGGIRRALRLATLATELGVRTIISHLRDGPIALASACELALAVGHGQVHGLARHSGLDAFPAWPVPQLGDLEIRRHHRPGLGVKRS